MMRPGSVMYSRAAAGIVRHHCEFCGRQLTQHQAVNGGLCGSQECHDRMIERVGVELLARKRRENAAYRDRMLAAPAVAGALAEALARLGADGGEVAAPTTAADVTPGADDALPPDPVLRAVVPYQDKPLAPQPAARRAAFAAHLETILAEAWAEGAPALNLAARASAEAPEPPLMDAGCATCQGSCCALGADTGFLVWTDIQRQRQRAPEATAEQIGALFLGHLPEQSVSGSCIYHGARGCTLPRTLRNDQCNRFHCKSLKLLAEGWAAIPEPRGAVLVAADRGAPRAVATYDPGAGWSLVATIPAPD